MLSVSDFNENTVACSPKVREVLGRISAAVISTRYPERTPIEAIVAEHLRSCRAAGGAHQMAWTKPFTCSFEAFLESRR